MIEISSKAKKGILYAHFKGLVEPEHINELNRVLPGLIRHLPPDFTVICDLSGMEIMDYACSGVVAEVMQKMARAGVGRVVRIIPDPRKDIGFGIMSIFHYPSKVLVNHFNSLEEALAYLELRPRDLEEGKQAAGLETIS